MCACFRLLVVLVVFGLLVVGFNKWRLKREEQELIRNHWNSYFREQANLIISNEKWPYDHRRWGNLHRICRQCYSDNNGDLSRMHDWLGLQREILLRTKGNALKAHLRESAVLHLAMWYELEPSNVVWLAQALESYLLSEPELRACASNALEEIRMKKDGYGPNSVGTQGVTLEY